MKMKSTDIGRRGEELAKKFLKKQGFRILESNYRCPEGEIDIVAQDKDCLVFTEVRTRTGFEFGPPEESVTQAKKRRMIATAYHYRQTHDNPPTSWRIDFVAVELNQKGKPSRIELFENAVSED
jgi:putative endonuclease